jgi:hypothetical protein
MSKIIYFTKVRIGLMLYSSAFSRPLGGGLCLGRLVLANARCGASQRIRGGYVQ